MTNTPLNAPAGAPLSLTDLGWRQFHNQQLESDELERTVPVRVVAVHRNGLHVLGTQCDKTIQHFVGSGDDKATIGDWLLLDPEQNRALRRLDRLSLFKRKAPGTARSVQHLCVEILNATDLTQVEPLKPWRKTGQTIAFVGSSGVGKSTQTNTLMGNAAIATQNIREDDAKGRHTTTRRELYRLHFGGKPCPPYCFTATASPY